MTLVTMSAARTMPRASATSVARARPETWRRGTCRRRGIFRRGTSRRGIFRRGISPPRDLCAPRDLAPRDLPPPPRDLAPRDLPDREGVGLPADREGLDRPARPRRALEDAVTSYMADPAPEGYAGERTAAFPAPGLASRSSRPADPDLPPAGRGRASDPGFDIPSPARLSADENLADDPLGMGYRGAETAGYRDSGRGSRGAYGPSDDNRTDPGAGDPLSYRPARAAATPRPARPTIRPAIRSDIGPAMTATMRAAEGHDYRGGGGRHYAAGEGPGYGAEEGRGYPGDDDRGYAPGDPHGYAADDGPGYRAAEGRHYAADEGAGYRAGEGRHYAAGEPGSGGL